MTAAEAGDVIHWLYRWGADSPLNKAPNDYPSSSSFARMMVNPGETADRARLVTPLETDEHNKIDAIVSAMMGPKPMHRKVLIMFYVRKLGERQIAEKLGVSRGLVIAVRREAENHVAAQL